MNILSIKIQADEEYDKLVRFAIDGRDLDQLTREYEKKHYGNDGAAGGSYGFIRFIDWNRECYFTRPTKKDDWLDGSALLLECTCHEWGCWNLFCTIEFTDDRVIWKDFYKHHRDWKYDFYFEFDKTAYLAQFEAIKNEFPIGENGV